MFFCLYLRKLSKFKAYSTLVGYYFEAIKGEKNNVQRGYAMRFVVSSSSAKGVRSPEVKTQLLVGEFLLN